MSTIQELAAQAARQIKSDERNAGSRSRMEVIIEEQLQELSAAKDDEIAKRDATLSALAEKWEKMAHALPFFCARELRSALSATADTSAPMREAGKDSERLTWLDNNGTGALRNGHWFKDGKFIDDMRSAIDAAMGQAVAPLPTPAESTAPKEGEWSRCPFCGSVDLDTNWQNPHNWHQVKCRDCTAMGPTADNANEARILWNRRGAYSAISAPSAAEPEPRKEGDEELVKTVLVDAENRKVIEVPNPSLGADEWRMLEENKDVLQEGDEQCTLSKWSPTTYDYWGDPVVISNAFRRRVTPVHGPASETPDEVDAFLKEHGFMNNAVARFARKLLNERNEARKELEARMLESKMIEHILDGEEGWQEAIKTMQICPTMQSAIQLRADLADAQRLLAEAKTETASTMIQLTESMERTSNIRSELADAKRLFAEAREQIRDLVERNRALSEDVAEAREERDRAQKEVVALMESEARAMDFSIGLTGQTPDAIAKAFAERDALLAAVKQARSYHHGECKEFTGAGRCNCWVVSVGARDAEKYDTKVRELLAAVKVKDEALQGAIDMIDAKINGLSAYGYLHVKFPATVGHIPIRDYFANLGATIVNCIAALSLSQSAEQHLGSSAAPQPNPDSDTPSA